MSLNYFSKLLNQNDTIVENELTYIIWLFLTKIAFLKYPWQIILGKIYTKKHVKPMYALSISEK